MRLENNSQMNDLDRRVSVAPMMDWSDERNSRWHDNNLRFAETACGSFVRSC
jgi:tRNA-dihydrouridine synthase